MLALLSEGVSPDDMKPMLNMPLTNIAVGIVPDEESVTVRLDVSKVPSDERLKAGVDAIGMIATPSGDGNEVTYLRCR